MTDVATRPNNPLRNDEDAISDAVTRQQQPLPSSSSASTTNIDSSSAIHHEEAIEMDASAPSTASAGESDLDDDDDNAADPVETVRITVSHRGQKLPFELEADNTVMDLFCEIEAVLEIPIQNIKVMVPKGPFIKYPFKDPEYSVKNLAGKTISVMGSTANDVQAVQTMCHKLHKLRAARDAQRSKAKSKTTRRRTAASPEDLKYTFMQVRPLSGLPHPERSLKLLMRLKEDPGIKAAMKKHKFTVALLTEMEPLAHTESTHEGTTRILGLNRNQGEVIELRLRTDAHDGYRDYKTIRKTLCHELTHNVHGPHDRQFWDLCHQIEREVDAADWKSSGQTIGESSRYHISGQDEEEDVHEDDGGWTGGEFVLGGSKMSSAGLSRREILAQAALERQRKEAEEEATAVEAVEKGWRPCQRPQPPNNDRNL
ncbi:ubiquitin and WLM domain-containing metalloprotease SPCC1442.07c [Trichoderma asperellum]|uniref:Ubiquitin and WLM domain-containing metalloprotease SPCC1442.07c n=1 Tax=Trichoderma asperellum TaxID=101201 RepID=A0A6V8R7F3_TRIAP|nr:WLM domain-containing protein [Trichoderma asperelloides]GFP58543.1 ubiquitin and WLM domain-containing metalloprotease SPCC1442.07c [Trichoderma asperellum]